MNAEFVLQTHTPYYQYCCICHPVINYCEEDYFPLPGSLGNRYVHSRATPVSQLVRNPPAMQETLVRFLGWEDPLEEGIGYPLQYSWASLVAQREKKACNAGNVGSIPKLGRCPGGGHGNPLHYCCLENPYGQESGGLQSMGSRRIRHN